MKLKVGLIGLGSIGEYVALGLRSGAVAEAELVGVLVRHASPRDWPTLTQLGDLLARAPDVIVEAASPDAVTAHAEAILHAGVSLVLASGSALMDPEFRQRVEDACRRSGGRVYVPSCALFGLDALYAAAGHLDRISLTVVEPGAERLVFAGDAEQAIEKFPSRLNVAAAALMAANHPVDVQLRQGPQRRIELTATGAAGDFSVRIHPTPLSVALSLLATLRRLQQPIVFG